MSDFCKDTKDRMISWVFTTKTILMLINYIIIFEKAFNSVINNSSKILLMLERRGNWSVVGTLSSVILFKYRTYISNFEEGGKTSLGKRLINNYLNWGAEVIREFFKKIGWDTVRTRGLAWTKIFNNIDNFSVITRNKGEGVSYWGSKKIFKMFFGLGDFVINWGPNVGVKVIKRVRNAFFVCDDFITLNYLLYIGWLFLRNINKTFDTFPCFFDIRIMFFKIGSKVLFFY